MVSVEIPDNIVSIVEHIIALGCFGYESLEGFVIHAVRQIITAELEAGCRKSVDFETGEITGTTS